MAKKIIVKLPNGIGRQPPNITGQRAQPRPNGATFYHGLVVTAISCSENWGQSFSGAVQVWEKDGSTGNLVPSSPLRNVNAVNYDPGTSYVPGQYVIIQYILGEFVVIWGSCWADPTQLAT